MATVRSLELAGRGKWWRQAEWRLGGRAPHLPGPLCFVALMVPCPSSSWWGAGHTVGCGRDMAVDNFPTETRLLSPPAPAECRCSESHVRFPSPSPQGSDASRAVISTGLPVFLFLFLSKLVLGSGKALEKGVGTGEGKISLLCKLTG